MCLDVLRLGFATAALRGKAVEDHRSPKRWRVHEDTRNPRSVLECASPLALWAQRGGNRETQGEVEGKPWEKW